MNNSESIEKSKKYQLLGLMSGTSLDGLDLAFCTFLKTEKGWQFEILSGETIAYTQEWKEQLGSAITLETTDHEHLHRKFGKFLADACCQFMDDHSCKPDYICSHGHTTHHNPEKGITIQIGDGQILADQTGITVVNNFRQKDVALGGQGAPLVPVGDAFLFPQYDCCLNLGGIANISFERNGKRLAYDVGMANMPLNYLMQQTSHPYDEKGKLARSGRLIKSLLEELNSLAYYEEPYPKSLGFEWFRDKVMPLISPEKISPADALHTLVHHNAEQIARAICQHQNKGKVLVTGGGAYNQFFIEVLQENLPQEIELILPESKIIDFKEALVFAFLGLLRVREEINVWKSVTGANEDSCSGDLFYPRQEGLFSVETNNEYKG